MTKVLQKNIQIKPKKNNLKIIAIFKIYKLKYQKLALYFTGPQYPIFAEGYRWARQPIVGANTPIVGAHNPIVGFQRIEIKITEMYLWYCDKSFYTSHD